MLNRRHYTTFGLYVQPSVTGRARWWLWPTILSLDAPIVVVLWQRLIGAAASAPAGAPEMVVLGCSVWLAYSADRWIEGWRLDPATIGTHRHRFYQRWRWPIAALWAAVLALDVTVALRRLQQTEFLAGVLVLIPVAAYLLSHQLLHRNSDWRPPKELCAALLLGAGAAVFSIGRPGTRLAPIAEPLALFILLCFSNCALISVWEHEIDRAHGQTSLSHQFAGAGALARLLPWVISAVSALAWAARGRGPAAACAAVSGVLLGVVDLAEKRTGRVAARVLADVALLTPLVPVLWGHA